MDGPQIVFPGQLGFNQFVSGCMEKNLSIRLHQNGIFDLIVFFRTLKDRFHDTRKVHAGKIVFNLLRKADSKTLPALDKVCFHERNPIFQFFFQGSFLRGNLGIG